VLARARPRTEEALRRARDLVDGGFRVALEPVAEFPELIGRVQAAGLVPHCELTLPVDRLGEAEAVSLAAAAGMAVALTGSPDVVDAVSSRVPDARVVVPAAALGAEERCRALAFGRVRLVSGRGAAADLAFVRCLNVLMAAGGTPAVATTDRRLVAVTGERAAWNDRTPDSWEHVMPHGVRTDQQRRLVAAGYAVRVSLRVGGR
jgi:proline dehydrogenase